jgi:non-heme chloroperoxidase
MPELNLSDGVTLAYDERGDERGCPLVMIHGVSMSRRYFHRQLEALGQRHRVIAVDLRGHGDSSKVDTGHTIPHYARDVARFIELRQLERPVLLGWSMGAFVAWDYVRQFGTAGIAGLIVCDEAASDFKWEGFEHGFLDLPGLHSLMTDVQEDREGFLRHLVPLMFHQEQRPDDVEWMVGECMKLPVGPLSAILFDQSVQDYRDTVETIDIPTLICWGRHDALLPATGASDLKDRVPHAEVVMFDDSGHCPFLEESEKFNATVGEFVGRLERQPGGSR